MRDRERDPFLMINSARLDDMVADGMVELLRERGLDVVTMGALARWLKVTPSALAHRARRPEAVVLLVDALGRRWAHWSMRPLRYGGDPPLPATVLDRHGLRVWWLVRELAQTEAAEGRGEALERWHHYVGAEDALVRERWQAAGRTDEAYAAFRAALDGARLALAFIPSLRLVDVEVPGRSLKDR